MRDPARIDRMIELLRQRWHQAPDQRLGQLVFNVVREHGETIHEEPVSCFVPLIEDDRMEQHLRDGLRGERVLSTNSFTTVTTGWREQYER